PTGQVRGYTLDPRYRKPLSRMNVFVFAVPEAWASLTDAQLAAQSYDALVAAHRAATIGPANPIGTPGIVSHFRSDIGLDVIPDGSFSGPLPAGRYLLIARDETHPPSKPTPIRVVAGETTPVTVFAGDNGTLTWEIFDDSGRRLPAKLTLGHCF